MIKRLILIALIVLCSGSVWAQDVTVQLNGSTVSFSEDMGMPYIDGVGRVMVPIRAVLEQAGIPVDYDAQNRVVVIKTDKKEIQVPIGVSYIIVDKQTKANDAPATIVNGRTYIPLRAVMESLGYGVAWDSGTYTVTITSEGTVEKPDAEVQLPAEVVYNTEGNSNINLYNGGMMAKENDDFYFVNFEDDERIWHINLKTGYKNRVSSRTARGINVANDIVYYRQIGSSDDWDLMSNSKNGKNPEKLTAGDVGWLKYQDGYVYYYLDNDETLYKITLKDKLRNRVSNYPMNVINMEGDNVVYTEVDDDGIAEHMYRYNYKTKTRTLITDERSGSEAPFATLIGDKVYYSSYNHALSLRSIDLTANKEENVIDRWTYNVTGNGSKLYTLFPNGNSGLYEIDLETLDQKLLDDTWFASKYYDPAITLIDDKIYYLKQLGSTRYRWILYDLKTDERKEILNPEDFLN